MRSGATAADLVAGAEPLEDLADRVDQLEDGHLAGLRPLEVNLDDLQRLLDLAADRGLQVIVFSCTPEAYAGLGARQVSLPSPLSIDTAAPPHERP